MIRLRAITIARAVAVTLSLILGLSASSTDGAALVPRERKDCFHGQSQRLSWAGGRCFAVEKSLELIQTLGFLAPRRSSSSSSRGINVSGHHQRGGHHRHWIHHRRPHRGRRRPRLGQRAGAAKRRGRRRDRIRRTPRHTMMDSRQNAAFNVMDFGAAGDGVTDDSQAFLNAWNGACKSSGTALVAVPAGWQFLVGPMLLLDGTGCTASITMMVNGEIVAPQDPSLWGSEGDSKWIYIHEVTNFVLTSTGGGIINGRGQTWWDQSCKRNPAYPCVSVPRAITFKRATNVVVTGLTFLNSQTMHLDFDDCNGVYAADLTISAPELSPNTDGIHLQNTINAVVQNCEIGTGDDCISIQTGCTNVLTRDIRCGPGHGISIGGLGKDSTYAQVSNVQVYNVTFSGSTNGLRIKSWQGASGSVNNVTHSMIQMNGVKNPIIVDQYYCDSSQPCQNQTSAVKIRDILYDNIWGTSATNVAINLACSTSQPCENVVLQNIHLTLDGGQAASAFCQNALGTTIGNVQPPSCLNS